MKLGDLVPQEKHCKRCDEFKEIASFDRDATKEDGYKAVCKPCRAEVQKAKRLGDSIDVLRQLEKNVITGLANSKPGGTDVPHVAEIYESAIGMLGGVHGLVQQMWATYLAAQPGSQTRERLLGQIIKIGMVISDSKKVEMPVELMSDQDLQREIETRRKGYVVEGQVKETGDGDAKEATEDTNREDEADDSVPDLLDD